MKIRELGLQVTDLDQSIRFYLEAPRAGGKVGQVPRSLGAAHRNGSELTALSN